MDTIAGLIIYEIGYIPEDDEEISIHLLGYTLNTQSIKDGRIRSVEVLRDLDYKIENEFTFKEGKSKEMSDYGKTYEYDED